MKVLKALLLLSLMFFIPGCNSMCSDEEPKTQDLIQIKNVDKKYRQYRIEIDKCMPSGYFNVVVDEENAVDTLLLDKIFYEVLDSKITAKEMQVLNKEKKLLYVQINYINPNTGERKPIRLKPEDL